MDGIAIRCEGIGKRYRLGERERYRALRDTLTETMRAPLRRLGRWVGGHEAPHAQVAEFVWALKDVSLQVGHGEVMGVIGRNGAGKTTLLKLLSRITKPTEGRAEIRGRVGALLEVGTGFHPELTGHENIYLNGAVLGMTRRDIDRRFEEIVEFSECGRFLDVPVKRYSSGMYMRLAFAVAAHLETEILFVDEVLAVGDAAFQKKCLGKMGAAAHRGRTVVFVSHNLLAVESLCSRTICLHEGRVVLDGPSRDVTSQYLKKWIPASTEVLYDNIETAPGGDLFRLRRARVRPLESDPSDPITVRTPFVVEFEYWKLVPHVSLDLGVDFFSEQGVLLFNTGRYGEPPAPVGLLRSSFVVPGDLLNDGTTSITLGVYFGGTIPVFESENLLVFDVQDVPDLRGQYFGGWFGAVRPYLEWTTRQIGDLPAAVGGPFGKDVT